MSRNKNQSKDNKTNIEEQVWQNLSQPGLTLDKTGGKNIESLSSFTQVLNQFKFISKINLSNNLVADFIQLQNMHDLIHLDLQNNAIKDLKALTQEEGFKNLQYLNLQNNKIVELGAIRAQNLKYLNLNENKIEKVENFEGHPKLETLILTKNKIAQIQKFSNMPNLKELLTTEQKLYKEWKVQVLYRLYILEKILLKILMKHSQLQNLQDIQIQENKIDKYEEIQKIQSIATIEIMIFSFNPIITKKQQEFYFQTLNDFPKIKRLNKIQITNTVKQRWIDYNAELYRLKQEEEARLAKEEQDRIEAEAREQENQ